MRKSKPKKGNAKASFSIHWSAYLSAVPNTKEITKAWKAVHCLAEKLGRVSAERKRLIKEITDAVMKANALEKRAQ